MCTIKLGFDMLSKSCRRFMSNTFSKTCLYTLIQAYIYKYELDHALNAKSLVKDRMILINGRPSKLEIRGDNSFYGLAVLI